MKEIPYFATFKKHKNRNFKKVSYGELLEIVSELEDFPEIQANLMEAVNIEKISNLENFSYRNRVVKKRLANYWRI